MRATLGDAKPVCGPVFTYCQTDPRLVTAINQAQRRLLPMGKWPGTYQHYRFCVHSGCITLPRQLETIETAAICNWPVRIANEWKQYIRDGFGLQCGCGAEFVDEGEGWVAFEDVSGSHKKLRVYSDGVEDSDAKILLQFYNENNLPVRTLDGTPPRLIDGEKVTISNAQVDSVNFCFPGTLVGVQKPITNGNVFLYEYDTVTTAQRLIAIYDPDETRPNYRRYAIPFSGSTDPCNSQLVDVIAKRRFIPAVNDQDWLIVGNLDALEAACTAIRKQRDNLISESVTYWAVAKQILDDELNQFLGDGMQPVMQLFDEFSNAAVCNMV